MITLYATKGAWGLPGLVPASMKLETWLRMAGIPYDVEPPDLSKSPKGKMPFVKMDGEYVGDSTLIIERLGKDLGKDLDAGLDAKERAISLAFRRMIKEDFYWVIIVDRWTSDDIFSRYEPVLGALFFPGLTVEQYRPILTEIRKGMLSQAQAQGMGRHTADEVHRIGIADVQALADLLGDKPFYMGDRPTTLDATAHGYIGGMLGAELPSPVRDHARAQKNLVAHYERMRDRYFPELEAQAAT